MSVRPASFNTGYISCVSPGGLRTSEVDWACRAHLEIWTDFHRLLVSGMHASVHGGFGRFSPFFHVKADSDLVDMQRRPGVPQFSSSTEFHDEVDVALSGLFAAICNIFSASVHPDVEAQVAGTPGV